VVAATNEPIPGVPGTENGTLTFEILRNPDTIWFDDYEARVIYDETGLYDYRRVD
jgi:hypothetical protein